ncbi:MAG: allantoinase AllB [Candidatus Thorarchaeota archaeon]|nr:allantoinase AllB [Candidatus Thorarchaeota archaeon]
MTPVDLVLRNGQLVLESGVVAAGLAVEQGKVIAIAKDSHLPRGEKVIDLKGMIVLPGLIDGHAHFHDPARLEHEDFATGSRAAAAGGVTTVIEMPLTSQVDTLAAVEDKIKQGESMSVIDFSLYTGMIHAGNIGMVRGMIDRGVAAFKAFTCQPYHANTGVIVKALSEVSEHGGHLTIHCESQGVLDEFAKEHEDDWDAPVAHSLSRPNLAEEVAVREVLGLAEKTGGHVHIAHVSTREALTEIERARTRGVQVTGEVCPHHLLFNRDDMNRLGPKSKMNPPLRTKEDRAALWSGLLRGTINAVVSDHAPCPEPEKSAGTEDIRKAWAGVDGTQMILRVLLSEGLNRGRMSLDGLLRVTSRNPAKIFGLYPRKGTIMVGSDADIVVIDPLLDYKVSSDMMFSKAGWTLYEGMKFKGAPVMTFVRGEVVYDRGEIVVPPGHGEFIPMGGEHGQVEER